MKEIFKPINVISLRSCKELNIKKGDVAQIIFIPDGKIYLGSFNLQGNGVCMNSDAKINIDYKEIQ
jgi:hypothetical protein